MSIIINNITDSSSGENFNEIRRDPISILPYDDLLGIFAPVIDDAAAPLDTLSIICLVCKEWSQFKDEPHLLKKAIYKQIAFGNDKWAKCFGADVVKDEKEDLSSLPWKEYIEDCKKFKSIYPEKNAKNILMLVRLPKTLKGGLTLESLGELAKKYFPNTHDTAGYLYIWPHILNSLGHISIEESCWVSMPKEELPGSKDKSYSEQQKMIVDLAKIGLVGYEEPEILKVSTCIFSEFFDSGTRLFSNNSWTFLHCKERVKDKQTSVGGFTPEGFYVNVVKYDEDEEVGIAPQKVYKDPS